MDGRKENTSVAQEIQSKRTLELCDIHTRNPGEISFEETVLILKKYLRRNVLNSTQDGRA